ncbi:hypothetical protein K32_10550 [Kaistia sp. 32K]|uniref:Wzz/FepE/Etk N-terminal domain-containing protein n=1 Tax=Kaistia sp. 32K TaxID=2795690 RepID=UPI0019151DAE|nr:Wzz/FepE/Etk N-terminal domain-containing protein [Kaistia sp. 32K]BCP52438.1 hypothetical protein K32_10550 [Kaistia sp. 32K]
MMNQAPFTQNFTGAPNALIRPGHASAIRSASDFFRHIRRSLPALALWVVLCVGIGFVILFRSTPEYTASTLVIVEPHRVVAGSTAPENLNQAPFDTSEFESQMQIVRSERLLRFVFDTLKLANAPELAPEAPSLLQRLIGMIRPNSGAPASKGDKVSAAFLDFMNRVGVRRVGLSYVLEISYRAPSPDVSASRANSIAAAYILDQIDIRFESAKRGGEYLQTRIADIAAERAAAFAAVQSGEALRDRFPDSDARILSAAIPPTGKSSPKSALILVFAFTIGLLSGLAFLAVRFALDRTIRTPEQVRELVGGEAVVAVPAISRRERRRLLNVSPGLDRSERSDFLDALRTLRAAILVSGRGRGRSLSVGVLSCNPREGRSAIALQLALTIAASGRLVRLLDCSFENATLTRALAPYEQNSLNAFFASGDAEVMPACVEIAPNLEFMPAVTADHPLDRDAFVGGRQMEHLLKGGAEESYAVLDLPSLRGSSDAAAIASLLDGVIIVVEAGRTTMDELQAAMAACFGNVHVYGIALNKFKA